MTVETTGHDDYGYTSESDRVGSIRCSSYYRNTVIEQLDALYTSSCDFAFITKSGGKAVGAHNDKNIVDHNGKGFEISAHRIVVRKEGKWEMLTTGNEQTLLEILEDMSFEFV